MNLNNLNSTSRTTISSLMKSKKLNLVLAINWLHASLTISKSVSRMFTSVLKIIWMFSLLTFLSLMPNKSLHWVLNSKNSQFRRLIETIRTLIQKTKIILVVKKISWHSKLQKLMVFRYFVIGSKLIFQKMVESILIVYKKKVKNKNTLIFTKFCFVSFQIKAKINISWRILMLSSVFRSIKMFENLWCLLILTIHNWRLWY